MLEETELQKLLEAVIMAAQKPMNEEALLALFEDEQRPSKAALRQALHQLQQSYQDRGVRLLEVSSGYQFIVNPDYHIWVGRLWEEKPARYSRALLETLALIAYRQPITRGEIEDIRGVSLSSSIFKTLLEDRDWIRVVGHREVPGRPALYATTKHFLDYFGLKSLENLPSLPEVMNLDSVSEQAEKLLGEHPHTQLSLPLDSADIPSLLKEALEEEIQEEIHDQIDEEVDEEIDHNNEIEDEFQDSLVNELDETV